MDRLDELERAIREIEERNIRVEAEKAWEVSFARRALIILGTYAIAVLVFFSVGSLRPFLDALIPMVAYILSTQSLPLIKRWWMRRQSKRGSA